MPAGLPYFPRGGVTTPGTGTAGQALHPRGYVSTPGTGAAGQAMFPRGVTGLTGGGEAGSLADYDAYLTTYLPMGEAGGDRVDTVGSNDFSVQSGSPGNAVGKYGNGGDFTSGDLLQRLSASDLSPADSLAVSFWFTTSTTSGSIFYKNASYTLWLHGTNGLTCQIIQSDSTIKSANVGSVTTYPSLTHVVGIADGAGVFLYVNGTKYSGDSYDGSIISGAGAHGIGFGITGIIDEIPFWKGITFTDGNTRDQFAADLYNSGAGRFLVGGEWVEGS